MPLDLGADISKFDDAGWNQQAAKSESARERIEREIKVTDELIDGLVYELYGLTKGEIKIIKGTT